MNSALRDRVRAFLEDTEPTRQETEVRKRVRQFLRDEEKLNDQRTPAYKGGGKGKLGRVTTLLSTSDLNPTAERDA